MFALVCFNNDQSIGHLRNYLEQQITKEYFQDGSEDILSLGLTINALIYLNEELEYQYYRKYYLNNDKYFYKNGESIFSMEDRKRVFGKMIDFKYQWFQ